MEVNVTISLKKGVADPEGANIKKALNLLGFDNVMDVKSMKTFRINIDTNDRKEAEIVCEKMCKKLLANPVIQNYTIEIR
ncbi:MAG: phosphoribosylformylglycinamidine synthase subunit PurS [Methanosarcinales archaeon Met12]|nr:MAG: phosphoribosylformylglycinamidine synthase subunit PurS [Methanosarcinales archaeon Met12]